jgi:hypothetical protein
MRYATNTAIESDLRQIATSGEADLNIQIAAVQFVHGEQGAIDEKVDPHPFDRPLLICAWLHS